MRMIHEDYDRGRNGGFAGMYERSTQRESFDEGGQRGRYEEDYGPMRRARGRERDTVRHANIVKVIEVLAESDRGWEDAANNALMEAQRSIRNIKSIWVKDMQCVVRDGRIRVWRLTAKISFAIEPDQHDMDYRSEA